MASGNTSFTTLTAVAIDNYIEKSLTDNIHQNNVLLYKLKEQGAVREEDGGTTIVVPIMYEKNTTVGSHGDFDTIDISNQGGITAAQFNWKNVTGSVVIADPERDKTSGKSQVVNLFKAKLQQLEESFIQEMVTQLYSDGTGNGSLDITGLKAAVNSTGTYGGISRSTDTYWQSHVEGTSEVISLNRMKTARRATQKGVIKGGANLIITTDTIYNSYEGLLTPTLRTMQDDKLVNNGFENILFERVPVVWDEACTSGYMYLLSTKYMELIVHKNRNMKRIGPVRPANQLVEVTLVSWYGNLVGKACKKQAVLTGKS